MRNDLPTLDEIEAALCKKSLAHYFRRMWDIIEPATTLEWNWHFDLFGEYGEAFIKGQIQNLCVNVMPRSLKSSLFSIAMPSWAWIDNPSMRFIGVSNNDSLANDFSIKRRRVLSSEWYQNAFNPTWKFTTDQNIKTHFENDDTGAMFASGKGGGLIGKGANRIIIDDLQDPKKPLSKLQRDSDLETFNFLTTRLNDKRTDGILVVMQRVDIADIAARCNELGYESLIIPAKASKKLCFTTPISQKEIIFEKNDLLHPKRFDDVVLAAEEVRLGISRFTTQYMQEATPFEGVMIKRAWLEIVDEYPAGLEWIRYYDIATSTKKTADSTACLAMAYDPNTGNFYLRDLLKGKWKSPDLIIQIENLVKAEKAAGFNTLHLIEPNHAGQAIFDMLMTKAWAVGSQLFAPPHVTEEKAIRVSAWLPFAQAGKIKLVRGEWNSIAIDEICSFRPNIDNPSDDIVDSVNGAFDWIRRQLQLEV
jgi:predicted phage terminase large subunit-like protein